MIAAAIETLRSLAEKAASVTYQEIDLADPAARHFRDNRGESFAMDRPVPSRSHTVLSLQAFLAAVAEYGIAGQSKIWHSKSKVILIIDDAVRRDTVTLTLTISDQWKTILEFPKAADQKAALALLQRQLRNCVPQSVIDGIRKIDAAWAGRRQSEVVAGREKGMAEFASELVQKLPEEFEATVPIYDLPDFRPVAKLQIALDVTLPPQPITFAVSVVPDDIDRATHLAMSELVARMVENEHGIPVLYGTP